MRVGEDKQLSRFYTRRVLTPKSFRTIFESIAIVCTLDEFNSVQSLQEAVLHVLERLRHAHNNNMRNILFETLITGQIPVNRLDAIELYKPSQMARERNRRRDQAHLQDAQRMVAL